LKIFVKLVFGKLSSKLVRPVIWLLFWGKKSLTRELINMHLKKKSIRDLKSLMAATETTEF